MNCFPVRPRFCHWLLLSAVLAGRVCAGSDVPGSTEQRPVPVPVPNADFESWPQSAAVPSGWRISAHAHGGTVRRSMDAAAESGVCVGVQGGYCALERTIPLQPNTEYRLEFTAQSRLENGYGAVKIEQNLGGISLPADTFGGGWQELGFTFNSRLEEEGRIIILVRGTGTMLVDNIRLFRVSEPGEAVTMEVRHLLEGLGFLQDRVVPDARDTSWADEFIEKRAGTIACSTEPLDWRVGQWVRYRVHDRRLIPSRFSRQKRPEDLLIECAITGMEEGFFWFQQSMTLHHYWTARPVGERERGNPVLINRSRHAVVRLLVDGPDFNKIRRYVLQIDDEPPLEFTDGQRAVLPNNDLADVLLKPAPATDGEPTTLSLPPADISCRKTNQPDSTRYLNPAIPVTGLAKLESNSPYLDRTADVIAWGQAGAENRLTGDSLVITVPAPPYIGTVRIAMSIPEMRFSPDYELAKKEILLSAGVDFLAVWRLAGARRRYVTQKPVLFTVNQTWSLDRFDRWRSTLYRSRTLIDEPYERQGNYQEILSPAEMQGKSLPELGEAYVTQVADQVRSERLWQGDTVAIYEGHEYLAWYDFRAGADLFVYEEAGRYRAWRESFPALKALSDNEMLRWQYAFIKGAADYFGKKWGVSIYRWMPADMRLEALTQAYELGAAYLGFWQESEEQYPLQEILAITAALRKHMDTHKPQRPAPADTLFVVPAGFVPQRTSRMWGGFECDSDKYKGIMNALVAETVPLIQAGRTFAVAGDDAALDAGRYDKVIRVTRWTQSQHTGF